MLPFSVGAIIECQTDQKLRTLQDIRSIIARRGGSITPTSFLFERKGKLVFEKKDEMISTDEVLDQVIEAGATDVDVDVDDSGRLVVETEPSELSMVMQRLSEAVGLKVEYSDIVHAPKEETVVSLKEEDLAELDHLVTLIEEDPSVQHVYINAA